MHITDLNSELIITSGDTLFVPAANKLIKMPPPHVPPNLTKGQLDVLNKEDRTITSIAPSRDGKLLAVSTENKQIVVFNSSFEPVKNFLVNRAPVKVLFTKSGDILVADRTGDVYLYKNDETKSILLLGHLSMILDMALSECEKYIITCDRDEKIRVSRFPNAYNIVCFCLGHAEFVNRVRVAKGVLVSASGDGTVRLWDYVKGEQLCCINTKSDVEETTALELFAEVMDKEKVDVTALPITDMQVDCCGGCVTVVVSLYSWRDINVYRVDLGDDYKWCLWHSIKLGEGPQRLYLNNNLYVFQGFTLTVFKITDSTISVIDGDKTIADFCEKHKDVLKISEDEITVLYKRKFDNMEDYLERKRLRLQNVK